MSSLLRNSTLETVFRPFPNVHLDIYTLNPAYAVAAWTSTSRSEIRAAILDSDPADKCQNQLPHIITNTISYIVNLGHQQHQINKMSIGIAVKVRHHHRQPTGIMTMMTSTSTSLSRSGREHQSTKNTTLTTTNSATTSTNSQPATSTPTPSASTRSALSSTSVNQDSGKCFQAPLPTSWPASSSTSLQEKLEHQNDRFEHPQNNLIVNANDIDESKSKELSKDDVFRSVYILQCCFGIDVQQTTGLQRNNNYYYNPDDNYNFCLHL